MKFWGWPELCPNSNSDPLRYAHQVAAGFLL